MEHPTGVRKDTGSIFLSYYGGGKLSEVFSMSFMSLNFDVFHSLFTAKTGKVGVASVYLSVCLRDDILSAKCRTAKI